MISLLKFVDGPWEKAKRFLYLDLEHIQSAINKRWAATFGDTNILPVGAGGLGSTSLTAHGLLVGEGASPVGVLPAATNGQLPIGKTGSDPVIATLTAGTGQTIVNGSGTITISPTPHALLDGVIDNDTLADTPVLGDVLIGNATPKWARLPGQITSTQKFLSQTGTGSVSAVPSWQTVPAVGSLVFFFYNIASDIATYFQAKTPASLGAIQTFTFVGMSPGVTLLETFATLAGVPNITFLPAGVFTCYMTGNSSKPNTTQLFAEFYQRTSGGVETLLVTSALSVVLTNIDAAYIFQGALANSVVFLASDRLVCKIKAQVSGSSPTVVISVEGVTAARMEIPSATVDATNFVPYSGATANVDLGTRTLKTTSLLFPLGTTLTETTANILDLRNGVNQQSLHIYNTFTDSSNYERGFFGWSGNTLFMTTNAAGTGTTSRSILIGTNGLGNLDFRTNNVSRWEMTASAGNIIAFTDNTMDIGAAGANRPRSIYAGTNVITPFVVVDAVKATAGTLDFYTSAVARWELSTGTWLAFADNTYDFGAVGANRPRTIYLGTSAVVPVVIGGTTTTSPLTLRSTTGAGTTGADIIFQVGTNGATEAMRILNSALVTFGGTSASFPAIKRVTTTISFRLADDSADAAILMAGYTHSGAEIDKTYTIVVPVTGDTKTMAAGQSRIIFNPAGTLALLTVTLPSSPVDGQVAGMSFTQIITGLTVNAPGGATVVAPPTTAAVDSNFRFLYQASSTSWFPCS